MHRIHVTPWLGMCEPFNVLSHLLGAVVFAGFAVRLMRYGRGDALRTTGMVVLAYTSVQTLVLSSLYHLCWPGPLRETMLTADVAGIFLLIAGCKTPVHLMVFSGRWRWMPLVLAWSVALAGAGLKLTAILGDVGRANTIFFLLFGWSGVITAIKLYRRYGWKFLQYAVYAGLSYTIGAIVLLLHRPTLLPGVIGPHELWHIAVLCGLGLHWKFVFEIAALESKPPRNPRPHWQLQGRASGPRAVALPESTALSSSP